MNAKALIPVAVGLCIGGFALKLVFDTVKKAKGAQDTTAAVWSPVEEIPRGTKIEDQMLETTNFPTKSVPQGAFTKKEELIGRVTRISAPVGLPIMDSMLLPPGAAPGLSVKPGFRAVSIKVDEGSGVSNLLQPGAAVDVIGYFSIHKNGQEEIVSRTLIENVEVAAVGERLTASNEKSEKEKERGNNTPARSVTLLVKPEDVPQIHLAEQRGKLKLSLRNSTDFTRPDHDDLVTESKVVGVSTTDDKKGGGFLDKFSAFFSANQKSGKTGPATVAKPEKSLDAVTAPEPVQFAHQMVLWNGENRQVMGWKTLDSMDGIELAGSRSKSGKSQSPKSDSPQQVETPDSVNGSPGNSGPQKAAPPAAKPADNITPAPEPAPEPEQPSEPDPEVVE